MTYRENSLDQSLDIAGSLSQNDSMTPGNEPLLYGRSINSGAGAFISIVGSETILSGLSGISSNSIDNFVVVSGAALAVNNGSFKITRFISASSIAISNSLADPGDVYNGSLGWVQRAPYTLQDDLNYARTDRSAIKGVDYWQAIPTYQRPTAIGTNVPTNLANIAGKTTDAIGYIFWRSYNNVQVTAGDGYSIISSTNSFRHSDNVNKTGVPCYDSGPYLNDDVATYCDVLDGYSGARLSISGGLYDGYFIYGRSVAGTSVSPTSIQIDFRIVAPGNDLSQSLPYNWDGYQPTAVDIWYGYYNRLDQEDEYAFRKIQTINVAGSGNAVFNHENLDTLVHDLVEDGYAYVQYLFNRISNITYWTNNLMTKKVREYDVTYNGNKVSRIVSTQYNADGNAYCVLDEQVTYSGWNITSISSTKTFP